jgi:hypothetical protein
VQEDGQEFMNNAWLAAILLAFCLDIVKIILFRRLPID